MVLRIVALEKLAKSLKNIFEWVLFFNKVVGCRPAGTSLEEHLEEHLSVSVYGVNLIIRYLKEKNASFTFY